MNARTVKLCQSMRNVIAVVHAHPVLRAAAAESTAFELFVAAVDDLTALHEEQASSRVELAQLAARKRALVDDINLMLARLHATVALLPPSAPQFAPIEPLGTRLRTQEFTVSARSIVEMAAKEARVFVENGLHPRTFDVARDLVQQLETVDHRSAYVEAHARAFKTRLDLATEHARKRREQLGLELRSAMTRESRAAWRAAASLGRTHRTKVLPSPPPQKLLAPPQTDDQPDGILGIRRLALRAGRRFARTENPDRQEASAGN